MERAIAATPPAGAGGRDLGQWLYAGLVLLGAGLAWVRYGDRLDVYETGILLGVAVAGVVLGHLWKAFRWLAGGVAAISLFAISQYHGQLDGASRQFWLNYFFGSQTAVMWMCALFALATGFYWYALLRRNAFAGQTATGLTWAAVVMGFDGLMTRWYESYLMGADIGHIPVSNLYEVFILFSLITALLYLYYEGRYQARQLGAFVLLVICAAVGFLLWYTFDRHANAIEPLIPALQSYWMKLHVPANFIGYGGFSLSAMLGVAWLMKDRSLLGERLPDKALIEDAMYKSIALGFMFFTLATILGALWAAEAWGGYWSWDPKESWALIVWLNYAAWLHMRLIKGMRGRWAAWWAVIGLLVTTFAFLGVNMFLSGLHSYGHL